MAARWTEEEDNILVALANKGAGAVSKAIRADTGMRRSESAVISRAHRLGVSLVRYDECIACGRPVKAGTLSRFTGMCRLCNEREYAHRSQMRRLEAERGYTDEEEALIRMYRRSRESDRQAIKRRVDKAKALDAARGNRH